MNAILRPDELAGSCYRVFCYASGIEPEPWEHLSLEHQEPWLRMALGAENALAACDGCSFAQAGAALADVQCGRHHGLLKLALTGTRNRTAYEALARHLMTLMDSEKTPDVGALEASWGPWAAGKVSTANDPYLVEMNHEGSET